MPRDFFCTLSTFKSSGRRKMAKRWFPRISKKTKTVAKKAGGIVIAEREKLAKRAKEVPRQLREYRRYKGGKKSNLRPEDRGPFFVLKAELSRPGSNRGRIVKSWAGKYIDLLRPEVESWRQIPGVSVAERTILDQEFTESLFTWYSTELTGKDGGGLTKKLTIEFKGCQLKGGYYRFYWWVRRDYLRLGKNTQNVWNEISTWTFDPEEAGKVKELINKHLPGL